MGFLFCLLGARPPSAEPTLLRGSRSKSSKPPASLCFWRSEAQTWAALAQVASWTGSFRPLGATRRLYRMPPLWKFVVIIKWERISLGDALRDLASDRFLDSGRTFLLPLSWRNFPPDEPGESLLTTDPEFRASLGHHPKRACSERPHQTAPRPPHIPSVPDTGPMLHPTQLRGL
jgi:hypothetical protein